MSKQEIAGKGITVVIKRTHKIVVSDRYNKFPAKSFSVVAKGMSTEDVTKAIKGLIKLYGLDLKIPAKDVKEEIC